MKIKKMMMKKQNFKRKERRLKENFCQNLEKEKMKRIQFHIMMK